MIALAGLAVDFGVWNQANSGLALAANVAALTSVKIAEDAFLAGDPNWEKEGEQAGKQWFKAQVGSFTEAIVGTTPVHLISAGDQPGLSVTLKRTDVATITANVTYNGQVGSIFGAIFGKNFYYISGGATAQVGASPFLDVEILLDNSGSMQIGAGESDIARLQQLTPCPKPQPGFTQSSGAVYSASGYNAGGEPYWEYDYTGYDGSLIPPVPAGPPLTFPAYIQNSGTGPSCRGALPPNADGSYPTAGPPCAFACHFDLSKPAGQGNDFYALARSTSGSANPIVLRFDLVKQAVNQVVRAMKQDNIPRISNLAVGIFAFASALTPVYPQSGCVVGTLACAAGNDWTTAQEAVGGPPTTANGPDTGIQPWLGTNGGNSDFHKSMATLLTYMTAAGPGTHADAPRKVLFLVTDGVSDVGAQGDPNRAYGGVNQADCNNFKALGFTIYVVYTPYFPVMNNFYIYNIKPLVEPTGSSTVSDDLQACASAPSDYLAATDGQQLDNALQFFLRSAINAPARFTS